jgi:hypothetical protein
MPARKRKKLAEVDRDPIVRFAESVKRSDAKAAAERQRLKAEKLEAERQAALAAAHAAALGTARRALDKAIATAKAARASGRGIAEADSAWKAAKAKVIELETGAPPAWVPKPPPATDTLVTPM